MTTADLNLDAIELAAGAHDSREDGVCVMELVAWAAGQPHSDMPPCVSPILRDFTMRWNDDLDDTARQRLLPYAARTVDGRVVPGPLAGTAGDGHDERRAWLLVDWQIRTFTPAWLRLAGLQTEADRLAGAAGIVDHDTLAAVQSNLEQARSKAVAAWAAARAAAR
ncbi:MAG TPA: hypothetical protein VJ653_07690, partial [Acidimicrobiales bacterium]|nr:hypothetical protein [Acidimicrobiales bacterium]